VRGDISTLLATQELDAYNLSMAHFSDLTAQAFAVLRAPAALAALLFLFGFSAAYWLRRRGHHMWANLSLSLVMGAFFFTANMAFQTFEPHLSSKPLADALAPQLRPGDALAIYGEYYGGSALGFYLHRQTLLYNGRAQGLEYGSYYPDAPKIFLDDHEFPALWNSPRRVYLFAPEGLTREVLVRLPRDSSYIMAESGGKILFVNQPLKVDQPSLAQLQQQGSLPAALRR